MKILNAIALVCSLATSYAHGAGEIFEVCTPEGPCAIRLPDARTGQEYWVIKSDSVDLSTIWDGEYVIVPDDEYNMVLGDIPDSSRLVLPAVEPTSGKRMERAKGGSKGGSKTGTSRTPSGGGGSSQGGSLISVGNITVGGSACTDCHKGSMYEIHKKKMDDK